MSNNNAAIVIILILCAFLLCGIRACVENDKAQAQQEQALVLAGYCKTPIVADNGNVNWEWRKCNHAEKD